MAKIVVDAGHGGNDPGASGNGIIEKEYTLKISQYIYDRLRQLGLDVKMTRTEDETLSPTERVNRVLDAFGNTSDVIVVSNHINAGGAEFIYQYKEMIGY
jgi:N-acetylmuramoyl-L-alanine amidase